jgi:hypothetical protein
VSHVVRHRTQGGTRRVRVPTAAFPRGTADLALLHLLAHVLPSPQAPPRPSARLDALRRR